MRVFMADYEEGSVEIQRDDSVVVVNVNADGISIDLYDRDEEGRPEGMPFKSWYYLNEDLTREDGE